MIGAFHVQGWFRWVESGSALKQHMSSSKLYNDDSLNKACFDASADSAKQSQNAPQTHALMLNRYLEIQKMIDNTPSIFFWTKWQLSKLTQEILTFDTQLVQQNKNSMLQDDNLDYLRSLKEIINTHSTQDILSHLGKDDTFQALINAIATKQIVLNDIALQAKVILLFREYSHRTLQSPTTGANPQLAAAIEGLNKTDKARIDELSAASQAKFGNLASNSTAEQTGQINGYKQRTLELLSSITGKKPQDVTEAIAGVCSTAAGGVAGGMAYLNFSGRNGSDVVAAMTVASTALSAAQGLASNASNAASTLLSTSGGSALPLLMAAVAAVAVGTAIASQAGASGPRNTLESQGNAPTAKKKVEGLVKQASEYSDAKAPQSRTNGTMKPPSREANTSNSKQTADLHLQRPGLYGSISSVQRGSKA